MTGIQENGSELSAADAPSTAIDALRRRAASTLFLGVSLGTIPFFAAATASPITVHHITGSEYLSGMSVAMLSVGTGLGATGLGQLMARTGRRPGLITGYFVALIGAVVATLGAATASFALFLPGLLLLGAGHSTNHLSRYAAAELAPSERRASAVSRVVWAATIGAVIGPNILTGAGRFAETLGLEPLAGTYMAGAVLFAAAALFYLKRLRPEPSSIAVADLQQVAESGRPARELLRAPRARMALFAMALSQFVMVLVMTVTPLHIRGEGHGLGAVGLVLSSHFVGMYGLSPVAGWYADRYGKERSIWTGFGVLLLAGFLTALLQSGGGVVLAIPLFLVGLGWSFSFVAGSALLAEGLAFADRTRLQGAVDTVVWSCSAVASLTSGLLLGAFGYSSLSLAAAVLIVLGGLFLAGRYQRPVTSG